MNRTRLLSFATFLVVFVLLAFSARGAVETSFDGEIADSQCALGVHSSNRTHKEMIEMGHSGSTAEDCSRYCVNNRGGRYVLITKREVFKLDNQELLERHAGQKVRITGTLVPENHIIQIKTISQLDHAKEPKNQEPAK